MTHILLDFDVTTKYETAFNKIKQELDYIKRPEEKGVFLKIKSFLNKAKETVDEEKLRKQLKDITEDFSVTLANYTTIKLTKEQFIIEMQNFGLIEDIDFDVNSTYEMYCNKYDENFEDIKNLVRDLYSNKIDKETKNSKDKIKQIER